MVTVEELKVNLFVWWTASRRLSAWSCPCVIIDVGDICFRVKSLDDFQDGESLLINDSPVQNSNLKEMRVCNMREVQAYFKSQLRDMSDTLIHKKRDFEDFEDPEILKYIEYLEEEISSYEEKVKVFLDEHA